MKGIVGELLMSENQQQEAWYNEYQLFDQQISLESSVSLVSITQQE